MMYAHGNFAETRMTLSKEGSKIIIKITGVKPGQYTLQLMRRPKRKIYDHDWIKVSDKYGYGMLANATLPNKLKQVDGTYAYVKYGPVPEWMGDTGYIQNQIQIEVPEGVTEFEYEYEVSSMFLPLLKPTAVTYVAGAEQILTTFDELPTSNIGLIGVDYTHKYIMLPFSFNLYNEDGDLISICKNAFAVNGNFGEKAPFTLNSAIQLANLRIKIIPR